MLQRAWRIVEFPISLVKVKKIYAEGFMAITLTPLGTRKTKRFGKNIDYQNMKKLSKKEFFVMTTLMLIAQGYSLFKIFSLEDERDELLQNFFQMMLEHKYSFNDMAILMSQINNNYDLDIKYWIGMMVGLTVLNFIAFYLWKNFKEEKNTISPND